MRQVRGTQMESVQLEILENVDDDTRSSGDAGAGLWRHVRGMREDTIYDAYVALQTTERGKVY